MIDADVGKISVKINGQEYTFASTKSRDRIISIAHHVDEVIRGLMAKGADGSFAKLSMLAAINIADELFSERDRQLNSDRESEQMKKDIVHFQQLWEEAKRSHLQYKDDAKAAQEQKDSLQEKFNAKCLEADNLLRLLEDRDRVIKRMEAELETAGEKLKNFTSQTEEGSELIRELRDKLKEIEGNYFELQMENIQMKGDLEHYRNNP